MNKVVPKESPDCSRNSELNSSSKPSYFRRKLERILSILYVGRCVPAATVLYYGGGAIAFGVVRGRKPLETVLFPLEFTTTGGLECVTELVRVLYGFYVEGAMMLLAFALAALRSHSSSTVAYMAEKYRLFNVHQPAS